ncbi:MAG: peptidase U32 family protein [Chlamydiota bacterium]
MMTDIEIMAPAGSWEALEAAIQAGADSIYFGVGNLNMRSRSSNNFTLEDLQLITERCRQHNVKSYLTLNIVVYDKDLEAMRQACDAAKRAGVSAVIASDMAVIEYANSIGLEVHISTQLNIGNIAAVKFYSRYADVVVLARELTLDQITSICQAIEKENICGPSGHKVKVEAFVHGALCVAISGKCYMSLAQYNMSANRGACLQACRRRYHVTDEDTGDELVVDNNYVMSPKDLCTIGCLDQLLSAGVSVLKIEGRGRKAEYVYQVVNVYRRAVEAIAAGSYTIDKIEEWKAELSKVYNRGFWQGGYYLGKPLGEWSASYGSQATQRKTYLGKVTNYFNNIRVAEFKLENDGLNIGDKIMVSGPTTGVVYSIVENLRTSDGESNAVGKGDIITIAVDNKVRRNDKLFLVEDKN